MDKYVNELLNFIENSVTCFHNISLIKQILNNFGFIELDENELWDITSNKKYYVIKDGASIIAFKTGSDLTDVTFNIVASHNDSPTFKIKPESIIKDNYIRLNTEAYGGMIASTWLDRPLSIAGRVLVKTEEGIESRLVNLSGHTFVIPNVAIHLTRNGDAQALNYQNDLLPLINLSDTSKTFENQLKKVAIYSSEEKILSYDLFLYNKEKGTTAGLNHELILSPKLDDLECAFASLEAFLESNPANGINVCAIFDNEEVGSSSNHGAASTFLPDVLERICIALNVDKYRAFASSMLVSADNAHAVHPAHPEKSDPTNRVKMNSGVVIKHHAGLAYTTEGLSESIFKHLCDLVNVPYQDYTNRSDMRGGSTLGHILLEKLSITSVDIGLAMLAMHSSYETAGSKDIEYMVKALKSFYDVKFKITSNKIIIK